MSQDLRGALERLERAGRLLRVAAPVATEYEQAAVLWRLADGPTVVFENVPGHRAPVVGNLLNTRDKLASALGWPDDAVSDRVLGALGAPIPAVNVDDAPCQEISHAPETDLAETFPIPLISEGDGGRYISAGVLTCRSPETGRRNYAICRLHLRAPGELGVFMAPTHSRGVLEEHRARGEQMEVAVAIGLHPAWLVASQFLTPHDESSLAGALFGEPAAMARCRTVGLDVPAEAEIVLEGRIDPEETAEEGPFGEFPGTYAPRRPNPVIRLTAVTSRVAPMYQMIVGGRHPEHLVTGAIAREAGLLEAVRAVVPGARQAVLTEGGTCRFHAVISIDKRFEGEGKLAMLAAFSKQDLVKHVTVVDGDIDPTDHREVEWAVANRMRAHEDLVTVPGAKSNPIDPMAAGGTVTKLGIDATLPLDAPARASGSVGVPDEVARRVADRWAEITGDPDHTRTGPIRTENGEDPPACP